MCYKNDKVVHHWVQQMSFLQRRYELQAVQELDKVLWSWLQLCNPSLLLSYNKYQIPEKGVSQTTILYYLCERTHFYMNQVNLAEVELSIDVFHHVTHGTWPYDNLLMSQLLYEAECRHIQGRYDESKVILNDLLNKTKDPYYLAKIKATLGQIDNSFITYMFPNIKFDNLSEALGYAEDSGDLTKVGNVYGDLGVALQPQYPALSLSLRWQAQVEAERHNDKYNAIGYYIQRAYSEADILIRYRQELRNPEAFAKDLKAILSIEREKLPTESLKAFYDETRGYLLLDDIALKRAIDYYERVGVVDKVRRLSKDYNEISHLRD